MRFLDTRAMNLLEQSLAASGLKHRAISSNLANINTPGYKAVRVDFYDRFQGALADRQGMALARTSTRHMGAQGPVQIQPRLYRDQSSSMRNDGNNVDVDAEMVQLAQNQIHYQALLRQASDRINLLSTVINEGGR